MDDHYITLTEFFFVEAVLGSVFFVFGALVLAWILWAFHERQPLFSLAVSFGGLILAIPLAMLLRGGLNFVPKEAFGQFGAIILAPDLVATLVIIL